RDADYAGMAATLKRLGAPADLAAEAGASRPVALSEAIKVTAHAQLARVSRRTWIWVGVAAIAIGIFAGYLVFYLAAGSLEEGPQSLWWYPQDAARQVITTADGATQNTVPIRSGTGRGFKSGFNTPTAVTQRVLGAPNV